MINKKFYNYDDECLHYKNLKNILKVGFCGVSLPDRYLLRIMKQDTGAFLKSREEHFYKWREGAYSHPAFELANLNELLGEAGLEKLTTEDFKDKRALLRKQ